MNSATLTTLASHRRRAGFTLAEILVTMLVLSLISGAVFSAFLFFNRSGINVGQYVDMDRQARAALEKFAVDVRMAERILAFTPDRLKLEIPTTDKRIEPELEFNSTTGRYELGSPGDSYKVEYILTGGSLLRQVTESDDTSNFPNDSAPKPLLSGVTELEFTRYGIGSAIDPKIRKAESAGETTQINIRLKAVRNWAVVREATNVVLSARYVLRNK